MTLKHAKGGVPASPRCAADYDPMPGATVAFSSRRPLPRTTRAPWALSRRCSWSTPTAKSSADGLGMPIYYPKTFWGGLRLGRLREGREVDAGR